MIKELWDRMAHFGIVVNLDFHISPYFPMAIPTGLRFKLITDPEEVERRKGFRVDAGPIEPD